MSKATSIGCTSFLLTMQLLAQAPGRGTRPPGGAAGEASAARPGAANPELVAKGKIAFGVNCSFCHGAEAKGGETGPNLVRSQIVLDDKDGDLIGTVVRQGRPQQGMPSFDLPPEDLKAIAAFIHSFPVGGRANRGVLINQLVGDPKAGQAYFAAHCVTCHSTTGDLMHIGTKYDTIALQGAMMGANRGGRAGGRSSNAILQSNPVKATVVLSSGEKVEGTLIAIDDFIVVVVDSSGRTRSFSREAGKPAVQIHDPVQAHADMLRTLTDSNMHDLTAYLASVK